MTGGLGAAVDFLAGFAEGLLYTLAVWGVALALVAAACGAEELAKRRKRKLRERRRIQVAAARQILQIRREGQAALNRLGASYDESVEQIAREIER